MKRHVPTGDWLADPALELFPDECGRVESAYISLRDSRCARAVQIHPRRLIFIYIGVDDLPIGIRLLEPVPSPLATEILVRLVEGRDFEAIATDGTDREDFKPLALPVEQADKTLHRIHEANEALHPRSAR